MIHSDSPFCEIVSRKNYFTTEIVTMDFLLVQLHFTIRQMVFFRIKDGCVLLSKFIDHEFYNEKKYKSLNKYAVHLPVANSCYFGIQKRIKTKDSWYFTENEE